MNESRPQAVPEPCRSHRQDTSRQPDIGSSRAHPSGLSFSPKLPCRPNVLPLSSLIQTVPLASQNRAITHPGPTMSKVGDESTFDSATEPRGVSSCAPVRDKEEGQLRSTSSAPASRAARSTSHQPSVTRPTSQSTSTGQLSSNQRKHVGVHLCDISSLSHADSR